MYVGRSFWEYGEFSEDEVDIFRRRLRPRDVALDIGANLGARTLLLAKLVGPHGAVRAFEPQRILFQILCGNLAHRRHDRTPSAAPARALGDAAP